MCSKKNKTVRRLFWMGFISTSMLWCLSSIGHAQRSGRATISGRVSADQGQVISFRVAAHNLDRRLWYTVFTNKGQYTVPQALPGQYEVMVDMRGYDSPHVLMQVGPGESKTVDLALKKHVQAGESGTGGEDEGSGRRNAGKIEYVNSREEIFPQDRDSIC